MVSAQEVILNIYEEKSESFLLKLDFEKVFDNVSWPFLFKLLGAKGFQELWISWVTYCLSSSRITCYVNDSLGSSFKMDKGLKQGCPLSPLLFILVVDSFDAIIKHAISSDSRNSWVLSNLRFADATLFSSTGTGQAVILKLILYCFELSSRLKINFSKSADLLGVESRKGE